MKIQPATKVFKKTYYAVMARRAIILLCLCLCLCIIVNFFFMGGFVPGSSLSSSVTEQPTTVRTGLTNDQSSSEDAHEQPTAVNTRLHNAIACSGYSLTGRCGPSVQSLQDQLTRCSHAMGLSEKTLEGSNETLNIVARLLSTYLSALQSIIPQSFLEQYLSPCWHSQLSLTHEQQENLMYVFKTKASETPSQDIIDHLQQQILAPALNTTNRSTLFCLPAFFLAGFPKCGTTTLHKALWNHSMIAKLQVKEPHWWARMPLDNMDQDDLRLAVVRYLLYFNNATKTNGKNLVVYDGSQSTLWDSNFFVKHQDYCAMPAAVSHILPRVKFIVMMRDPVARTYSHYLYTCKRSYSDDISKWPWDLELVNRNFHQEVFETVRSFNQCLSGNKSAFECVSKLKLSGQSKTPLCGKVGHRLVIGLYYVHLLKWLQFFSKDQFLFLRMEDMSRNPHTFMTNITHFLNISAMPQSDASQLLSQHLNKMKTKITMLPKTRNILSNFFRPFNQQLVDLTGNVHFLWEDD